MPRLTTALLLALACAAACGGAPQGAPPAPQITLPTGPPAPPTIEVKSLQVVAAYPGASPDEVESQVTKPLEQALASLVGVTRIESASALGSATITLTLAADADLHAARVAVAERIQGAQPSLPSGVMPLLAGGLAEPIGLAFALRARDGAPAGLHEDITELRAALLTTPGVAEVELCGDRRPEVLIAVDPARLRAFGVALPELRRALVEGLAAAPSAAPGIRIVAPMTLEELGALVIKTGPSAAVIELRDLATVALTERDPACDAAAIGGGAAIVAVVRRLRGADVSAVDAAVRAKLRALAPEVSARGDALEVASAAPITILLDLPTDAIAADTVRVAAMKIADAFGGRRPGAYLQGRVPPELAASSEAELLLFDAPGSTELQQIEAQLATIPGLRVRDLRAPGAPPLLHLRVVDDDLGRARAIAERALALALAVPGVRSARLPDPLPELTIELRRDDIAALGLRLTDVAETASLALHDPEIGALRQRPDRPPIPIHLHLGDPNRGQPHPTPETIAALELPLPAGGTARLDQLVTLRRAQAPAAIDRSDHQRTLDLEIRLQDPQARAALERTIATNLELPPGVALRWE